LNFAKNKSEFVFSVSETFKPKIQFNGHEYASADEMPVRVRVAYEFLNRVDDIIIFDRLTEDDLKKIVEIQLKRLSKRLEQQKITLKLSDSAKELLAREGYDPVYGARPLRRTIQREILDPLSIDILEGKVREGQTVYVNAKDGALEFQEK
jgi:ATP-dependent Clp protease ATP-binding subunit ClpB